MRKKASFLFVLITMMLSSCDGEFFAKGLRWGFDKMAGEGFIPSSEIIALGEFERTEIHLSKNSINGKSENQVEMRLYNGRSKSLLYNEEDVARKCAELYARGYSKIEEYEHIKILLIQTDPNNPENVAINEYVFQVTDFLNETSNPHQNGI